MSPDTILRLLSSPRDIVRSQGYALVRSHYATTTPPPEIAEALVRQVDQGPPWEDALVTAFLWFSGPHPSGLVLRLLREGTLSQKRDALSWLRRHSWPEDAILAIHEVLADLAQGSGALAFDAALEAGRAGAPTAPRRLAEIIVASDGTDASLRDYAEEMLPPELRARVEEALTASGARTLAETSPPGPAPPVRVDVYLTGAPASGARALLGLRAALGTAVPLSTMRAWKDGDPPLLLLGGAEETWARAVVGGLPEDVQRVVRLRGQAEDEGKMPRALSR